MVNTFVFMGLPGSGKDKQSELLSEKTGFNVFVTSSGLKEIVSSGSGAGRKISEEMNAGDLVPDWLATYIFQKPLFNLKAEEGIIFNGGGRREPEARLFAEICEWLGRDFRIVYFNVSEATAAKRLSKRLEIEGRKDDDPSILTNRIKNFYENTAPSVKFFRSINKVIDINGEPLPDAVFAELWQKVSAL